MDETEIRHVLEAALLASHKPLPLEKLVELFSTKAPEVDKAIVSSSLEALESEYENRGLEVKQVASGFRIQVRSRMAGWLHPLWEERPPRYSRALLETLALIAYRQPVTRGEIEEVRGVAVNTNIIRTMLERDWIRVVGHRDIPGKPEMFGTTKLFLDYFGLQSIDQLPALAEIREQGPEAFPQADFIEGLEGDAEGDAETVAHADSSDAEEHAEAQGESAPVDAEAVRANTAETDAEVQAEADGAEADADAASVDTDTVAASEAESDAQEAAHAESRESV